MKVITGDLWDYAGKGWIVIPTNLSVNPKQRTAAMGLGVAGQARERYSGIDGMLYHFLIMTENTPQLLVIYGSGHPILGGMIIFPTKDHPRSKSSLEMIENGLRSLTRIPILGPVYVPFLGVGYGKLEKAPVKALMDKYLTEDRFVLVERAPGVEHKYPDTFRTGKSTGNPAGAIDRSLAEDLGQW